MLKNLQILKTMDPDDENVYASNILEKYENLPDNFLILLPCKMMQENQKRK